MILLEKPLSELISLVQENQGEFELVLAHCNYFDLRREILQALSSDSQLSVQEIKINPNEIHLLSAIKAQLNSNQLQALTVNGLEKVNRIDELLKIANQVREEFQKKFHYPVIFWVNDRVAEKFIKIAPDFHSWGKILNFTKTPAEIRERLREKADELFDKALTTGDSCFISPEDILSHDELDASRRNLNQDGEKLEPDLEACIAFIQAREFYTKDEIDRALQNYHKSLNLWEKVVDNQQEIKLRKGVIVSDIGLCYFRKAELHRAGAKRYWQEAKKYFQKCIESFKSADKEDLIAKYSSQLAEVLLKLEQWHELQELAKEAIPLHKDNPRELAQDYGYLAEVALSHQQWLKAEKLSKKALKTLENYHDKVIYYRSLFLLARSLEPQGKITDAIDKLETIAENELEENPQLYINILAKLRSLLLQQNQYPQAFRIKEKLRSFEYEYGFRAFIGAGYLRTQKLQSQVRDVPVGYITELNSSEYIDQEYIDHLIETSGRRWLVKQLLIRLSDTRHKLTIIYGQSGVGKSSLIHSALIPALKGKAVDFRDFITVFLEVFDNWEKQLGQALYQSLKDRGISLESIPNNISDLIKIFIQNEDNYLQTVVIFDQFEDIFFIDQKPGQRNVAKNFFEFLSQCLDLPFIKIILSIREDYVHHLLIGSHLVKLKAINNDILGKDNLCYLENFKFKEAKSVIKTLTDRSQFQLESSLIDQLVQDLAEPENEVRPIELQIVGSALQDMDITTLENYHSLGYDAKDKLITRYLDAVFEDCGLENKQNVLAVLETLIDEQHHDKKRRLTKSQIQLASNLNYLDKKLELILDILEENNIIFRFPFEPEDQYKIVHDYLVYPIQQKINAEKDRTTEITLLQQLLYQLRTPVASMVGLSEMLSDDEVNLNSLKINEALRKISSTGKQTIEQLSDILDLYKLESGTLKLYPESFNIDPIVKEVIDTIKATKPQLPLNYNPKSLGRMKADLTRVRQCFRNILINAVNLSQSTPIILDIQRQAHGDKQWIIFCVKSGGINLSQARIEQLLQTTTQNKSNQPQASRIAQQLTITKKLCQLMGGRFQITNPPGKSISFIMEIPS